MRVPPVAVILVLVCGLVGPASAVSQELRMTRMRMAPAGTSPDGKESVTLEMDAGETVSKQGVVIPFERHLDNGKPAGYLFQRAPLLSLRPGDQLRMYVSGLEPEPGAMLDPERSGPWRLVTVAKLREVPDQVHLEIVEKLRGKDGGFVQEIVLIANSGRLLSGDATQAGPAAGASAPSRSWSF